MTESKVPYALSERRISVDDAIRRFNELVTLISQRYGIPKSMLLTSHRNAVSKAGRRVIAGILRGEGFSTSVIAVPMKVAHTSILRQTASGLEGSIATLESLTNHFEKEPISEFAVENEPPPPDYIKSGAAVEREWEAALSAYKRARVENRADVWRERMKALFPYSWEAQAAMLPNEQTLRNGR